MVGSSARVDIKTPYPSYDTYFIDKIEPYQTACTLLLQTATMRKYWPGQVLYMQGETGSIFYFIKRGRVKISITNEDGEEKILAIQENHTFCGEHIVDHQPYIATATTLEEADIYVIERARFESLINVNPSIALMLLHSIVKKQRLLATQVGDLCFLTAQRRVAHVLLEMKQNKKKAKRGRNAFTKKIDP